jgi:tRNA C32,U32 (ribose-2'-O)-methylase TrmJ
MRRVLGRAKLEKRDVKLFQRISSEVERGLGSLGRERDGRSREKRDN